MFTTNARTRKATAVVALGFLIAGVSVTAASAATTDPTIQIAENCVVVQPVAYQAAIPETFSEVDNPDYVPAVQESSHVVTHDAVTHPEYNWRSWDSDSLTWDFKWAATDPGEWWFPAPNRWNQESRIVEDKAAWNQTIIDVEAKGAVGEPTMLVSNNDGQPEILAIEGNTCETKTMQWAMAKDDTDPITPTFPQVPYTGQCGVTIQTNVYRYGTDAEKAIVNALADDGQLTDTGDPGAPYEDSSVYTSHVSTQALDCAPPLPADTCLNGGIAWDDPACQPTFEVAQQCGTLTVTYYNNSKWDRWPDYTFTGDAKIPTDFGSGNVYNVSKVLAGQSKVIVTQNFAEDFNAGAATFTYQDILGAERDIDTAATVVNMTTDCAPPLAPVCAVPDFANGKYEVHLGQTLADRNKPATFDIDSYGGLIAADDPSDTFAEIQAQGGAWNNTYIRSDEGEYTTSPTPSQKRR